jgi:hypothetical protein
MVMGTLPEPITTGFPYRGDWNLLGQSGLHRNDYHPVGHRGHADRAGDPSSSGLAAQIRSYQDGLRLAGEHDHADEDADFGVPTDGVLHGDIAGFTPKGAPGVKTIRTAELSRFLVEARAVLIDTLSYSWGRSIPGAVGLKFAGLGGSFTDAAQYHLRSKMRDRKRRGETTLS